MGRRSGRKRSTSGKPRVGKHRVDIRRNKQTRTRAQNLTHELLSDEVAAEDTESTERLSGKGSLSRRRTVVGTETHGDQVLRSVSAEGCRSGRVISFTGLNCTVQADDDRSRFLCTTRGILRTLSRESRNVVVTGDRVLFREEGEPGQGVIERIEPRTGIICRSSQGKRHVLVASLDQLLIVASAAQPDLKTNLIDRFLAAAEKQELQAVIAINKSDLTEPTALSPIIHVYERLGYRIVATSAETGEGIDELRHWLKGRQTAVTGQSGVGKSSILNTADPTLDLRTSDVSDWSGKGRHTTRRARLLPLSFGGWVADTPGIRQFELWDVEPEEVEGLFREFRPFVPYCRFPDCTHLHEDHCGVKAAVSQQLITEMRYDSYCRMLDGDQFFWQNVDKNDG